MEIFPEYGTGFADHRKSVEKRKVIRKGRFFIKEIKYMRESHQILRRIVKRVMMR
jgi:hypothetical protein